MGVRDLPRWLAPVLMVLLAAVIVVGIVTASPPRADRADALADQLRCPVCQGESVADSPSDTAVAIRQQVAEMVAAGRSDEEIRQYYVERYGRWVILDPPARGDTLWLWLLPVAAATGGLVLVVARRRADAPGPEPDDDDRAVLRREVSSRRRREEGP